MEQSLFIRLLTLVDDFGRYEGDPELIRSEAFPYGDPAGNPIPVPTIDSACQHLSAADLVIFYEIDGKKYLQVTRWQERVRAAESKFPAPLRTNASKCQQMTASPPSPSPQPTPSPTPARGHPPAAVGNSRQPVVRESSDFQPKVTSELPKPIKKPVMVMHAQHEGVNGSFDELRQQLYPLFKRSLDTRMNYEEEHLLSTISQRPEVCSEVESILQFWRSARYRPQSLASLLRKWDETVDRARSQAEHDARDSSNANEPEPLQVRESRIAFDREQKRALLAQKL